MPRRGVRKYGPLTAYLAGLTEDWVTLTVAEVEAILGVPLPRSARTKQFWTNVHTAWVSSSQARAWRQAGWRVAGTHLHDRPPTVTFARLPADSTV